MINVCGISCGCRFVLVVSQNRWRHQKRRPVRNSHASGADQPAELSFPAQMLVQPWTLESSLAGALSLQLLDPAAPQLFGQCILPSPWHWSQHAWKLLACRQSRKGHDPQNHTALFGLYSNPLLLYYTISTAFRISCIGVLTEGLPICSKIVEWCNFTQYLPHQMFWDQYFASSSNTGLVLK